METHHSHLNVHNTNLVSYHWEAKAPKAVIVIVHGMGEHAKRYESSIIAHLLKAQFSVVSYDNFGHGNTKGKRGHCPSYEALQESVGKAINKAKEIYPDLPIVLYGHSMGGNLVLYYALGDTSNLKAVIATSPLLRLAFEPPRWKTSIGKFMQSIYPSITLPSGLDAEGISRDVNEVKRYKEDTLVHDKVSPMFSFPVFEAGEYIINNIDKIKIPICLAHGSGDKITSFEASKELSNKSDNITFKSFEDGYHELHHDLCKEEFFESLINWLNKTI